MPSLVEQKDEIIGRAKGVAEHAKAAGRDLTADELATINGALDQVTALDAKITNAKASEDLLSRLGAVGPGDRQYDWSGANEFNQRLSLTGAGGQRFAEKAAKAMMTTAQAGGVKSVVATEFDTDPVAIGQIPLSLLDVLPTKVHTDPSFAYFRQNLRDPKAAPTSPGSLKPISGIGLELVTNTLTVVPTLSSALDRFWLMDYPSIQAWVANEMVYAVRLAMENQIINGDGVAPNITGILLTSGIQTQAFVTDALTTLRTSITDLEKLGYKAGAFCIHPSDWESVELARTATAGALEFSGGPVDRATQRVWSTPVVTSTQIAVGTGILLGQGANGEPSTILDVGHEGLLVDFSEGFADDFGRNQVRVRAEQRMALSVARPEAVVKIALTATP